MSSPARRRGFVSPVWLSAALLLLLGAALSEGGRCPSYCICDNIQLAVACVKRNLTEVPEAIPEVTKKLDLRGNALGELPTGAFLHTPYLTHLSLQHCGTHTVQEGAFRGLGRLVYLNLADNCIEILYQESFDGLTSLKQLVLDRNRVEEVQPGAFSQLGALNFLSLAHNFLVYLPDMALQGLQGARWLRLSHNALSTLAPEAFAGLLALQRLSLDHNELQFFPTETLTRLPELSRLEMGWNPMTYLGEEAVAMPKLRQLLLDHMSLQDLSHSALLRAPRLALLDLSHNQLRVLQPLDGPQRLSTLNLTGNPVQCDCFLQPLREWADRSRLRLLGACWGPPHFSGEGLDAMLPAELRCPSREAMERAEREEERMQGTWPPPTAAGQGEKCPEGCACQPDIHHATCEGRGLTKIPRGFPPDTSLLDLRGNRFHYIPGNAFGAGLGRAVSLHLQRCGLVELQPGAFTGLRSLVYLYLSQNDIAELTPEAFRGLPQLTYLHLDRNRFTQFPVTAFKLLPNLLSLHLQHNSITRLGEAALAGAQALRGLYLEGNLITRLAPSALAPAPSLDTLHLGANRLTEVPTATFHHAPSLAELRLSGNPIRWLGPSAFLPLAGSLRDLYLDGMGLEKLSKDALSGLGPGLRSLLLEGNQLEEVPGLQGLTGLELVNLADNPLFCDCPLLPLRKWIEKINLKVRATCGNPPELRGKRVQEVHVFKSCAGASPPPSTTPRITRTPKTPKPPLSKVARTPAKPRRKAGAKSLPARQKRRKPTGP
ncbi:chondroadherin-like b [Amia ocellicauda]|uniref:chondroadherin-like b n=1 Tax=Amia ocellicauda TaxID=2972642 RepID=UPI0034641FBB